MQVWTIANQKGGVAKTTTSAALAGFASKQGLRALMIDIDPQGSLTSYFKLDPDTISLSSFTLFNDPDNINLSTVVQLISPTDNHNLSILPSSTLLATLERKAITGHGLGLVLKKTVNSLRDDFDLVVIDCPPMLGILLVNALAACDRLIIPVQTEFLALKGLERMLHTLKMLGRSQKKQLHYAIVPTMYDKRTQASVTTLRKLRFDYGESTWPGMVPVDTKLRDASKAGILPHVFAEESHGTQAYESLYNWLAKGHEQSRFWHKENAL